MLTTTLTFALLFILALLSILLLILILNLCTFQRLHPTSPHLPANHNSPTHTQDKPLPPVSPLTSPEGHPGIVGAIPCGRPEALGPRPAPSSARPVPSHLVSVLIPARSEEHCIEACVRSLVAQHYEPLEILVLDDESTDATAAIVERIRNELPPESQTRLQLLHGNPLPPGWIGKNFACHQLAAHAHGDYLLFTDADTVHAPATVAAVISHMYTLNLKLLTAQPEHVQHSLGERLIVPLLNFTLLTLLPIPLIRLRPEPSLATGNGQFLCFHRSAYHAIGGHAHVKDRILEDVLLARATKAAGYPMAFVDAFNLVQCRMYRSFPEVWQGFSKNLFAFYNYNLAFALLALLLNLSLFILPPLLLLTSLFTTISHHITFPPSLLTFPFTTISPLTFWLALTAYTLPVLMRTLLTLRFTRPPRALPLLLCLLHPISILLECLILLNSIRWHYRKQGTTWKGRSYNNHPTPSP